MAAIEVVELQFPNKFEKTLCVENIGANTVSEAINSLLYFWNILGEKPLGVNDGL